MEDFEFYSPTDFVFGRGVEENVGAKLSQAGATHVLVHYGRESAVKSGLIGRIIASLEAAGINHVELGGVRANPEVTLIREGIALAREAGVDWILAVGGGSVIDSAKGMAAGMFYDGDVWEIFEQKPAIDHVLPIACVLTIPAAGSEGSKNTVVSNDELGMKSGYPNDLLRSKISFLNPELTFTLPKFQTACGITDMFSHLLERFFGSCASVPVTDNLALSLMRTIRAEASRVMADPFNYEARANLMWAGMLCHNGIAGCGRIEDWATHALEHELSALDPSIAHGAGLAVMFPAWMHYVCDAGPERFAQYGREVFGLVETGDSLADAHAAIEETARFFTSLGLPTHLSELGIGADDLPKMLPTLEKNKG
ncbi:MAG: iron-containing alcohol dehydrogenase, partial [Raoultibacter sp.]